MLDLSIFCDVDPLTNEERAEVWRRKKLQWKVEEWWRLTHGEDGIVVDTVVGDVVNVPSFLRRQAS